MGFTKNELPTDRRRKVTSDIDGFPPFFPSVREWQLAPPVAHNIPPAHVNALPYHSGIDESRAGIRRESSGNGGGLFNYLRGLLVTKTLSLAVKSCLK